MNPWFTFLIAVRALARNRLRAFLTALGIIIGVAAVIAMVSIGEGAKARVQETFASMGTHMLVVRSGSSRSGGVRGGAGSQPTLSWTDLEAIRSTLPSVRLAAPELRTSAEVIADSGNWTSTIHGVTPDYFDIRNWSLALGSPISESDVAGNAKVALLGQTVVRELYGEGVDPRGQIVRIRNAPFEVVGVLGAKGDSGWGGDNDDVVFVPVSSFQARIEGSLSTFIPGQIVLSAVSESATGLAEREVTALLRERHRIGPGKEDDFSVRNLGEIATASQESTQTLTALLASIAFVSLVVGGIGIMNIMLVSVTERTREIGVRMAVGARPRDILGQFLIESLTLALVGGLLGVGLGVLVAQQLAARFDWSLLIRVDIVLLSVGISGLIGVIFGLYPAHKASRLDPIDALRYE
ncbi:ABC transporter permease [Flagellatimonas centrodinii]|uniref:ABC transporter permease n=1 Tax=Flagellatimonas centrodinii TaxID=2806210 RepID=UPI001FEDB993|nr:ABC transporter permease [Flagellatimonas centrodinii]ULQ47013.1 ABC transporter permease [Flagellatimonas centrodinii]